MYKRAFSALREGKPDEKEEAVMLLEAWRGLEQQSLAAAPPGSAAAADRQAALQAVEKRMPRRVKRKRPILTEDGLEAGMEVSHLYHRLQQCFSWDAPDVEKFFHLRQLMSSIYENLTNCILLFIQMQFPPQ